MVKNVGTLDRIIRIILVIIAAILYFAKVVTGGLAIVVGIIALALLITTLVSYCPLYTVLKVSTKKKEQG